jgi:hypothetical protein
MVFFKNSKGNISTVLAITLASMSIMTGVVYLTGRSLVSMKVLVNEQKAQLGTQMMLTLITQAVAGNGILCDKKTMLCKWNPEVNASEFAITEVINNGANGIDFTANLCLPVENTTNVANCENTKFKANALFKDIKTLMQQGLVNSVLSAGDQDSFGVVVTAKAQFYGIDRDIKTLQKSAIVRRPRSFLKIESEPGVCFTGCLPFSGNFSSPPCFSGGNSSAGENNQSEVNVRVMNDGPGYIHDFIVNRNFEPDPMYGPNPFPADQKARSFKASDLPNFQGLAPGKEFVFKDPLPCLTRKVVVNTTVPFGSGGSRVEVSSSSTINKGGEVTYLFEANSIDPDNVLVISRSGATIPATTITINNITELPPPPPPPAPPGGDGGGGWSAPGDGGGGDGCDGSGGGGGCDGT